MRRLDKVIRYATEYARWSAHAKGKPYDSSKNPYYLDVLFELLILQDGLCAYTEYKLLDKDEVMALREAFVDGKVRMGTPKPETFVDLEHFDPTQKEEDPWNWSNLFAVWDSVNDEKARKPVDDILKPDHPDYDPFRLLIYNSTHHRFRPNPKLSDAEKERVDKMLSVLCINYGKIVQERRDFLESKVKESELTGKEPVIDQFPTAYAMLSGQAH